MSAIVRTCYSGLMSTCKLLGLPYTPPQHSTLNEKFNVNLTSETFAPSAMPNLKYVVIGNKGVTYDLGTSGYVLTNPIPHLPRDASLYNHIPFRVVKANEETLTIANRYRLRVPVTIGGVSYIAYYAKALDYTGVTPSIELRNVDGENVTTTSFEPSVSDLAPSHPVLSNVNVNDPSGDYLIPTAKVNFTLTKQDIDWIIEACELLWGNSGYAVINEIGLCTGVERDITGNAMGTYKDAVAVQIAAFIAHNSPLNANSTEITISLDIGTSELLRIA